MIPTVHMEFKTREKHNLASKQKIHTTHFVSFVVELISINNNDGWIYGDDEKM